MLQVRVSAREAEAFEALVAETGMTTSGLLRHMIRLSSGIVAFRRDEVTALKASANQQFKGSQQAHYDVTHSISVGDGRWGTYTAPELPDSRVPALWGQRSMKEKRCLIDTFTGRIYLVGPGGYELKLSPGSIQHDLVESSAGHLMLPCSCFDVP